VEEVAYTDIVWEHRLDHIHGQYVVSAKYNHHIKVWWCNSLQKAEDIAETERLRLTATDVKFQIGYTNG